MNATRVVGVTGIGAFLPGAPDWMTLRDVLRGQRGLDDDAPATPAATLLPATERRRAPDSVRLAAEVAAQACAMAGRDPASLPCVFASTHGEPAITDYVCATLAHAPRELSPTRFHNSVLNAPAGYWTIATGCAAASSAVTAGQRSFTAGLLETLAFACAEHTSVLFCCGNVAASGPYAEMARTTLMFGAALVLSPDPDAGTPIHWSLEAGDTGTPSPVGSALQTVTDDNPANAQALALLSALCRGTRSVLALQLSRALSLHMEIVA